MSGVHLWGFLRMRLSGRGTRLAGRPASHAPSRSVALWGLLRPRSHGSGSPAGLQGSRASFRSCGSLAASPWSSRSGRHYPRPPSGGFNRSSTRVTVDRVGSSGELSGCQLFPWRPGWAASRAPLRVGRSRSWRRWGRVPGELLGVKCRFAILRKAGHFIFLFSSNVKSTSDLKGNSYLFYKFISWTE